MNRAEPTVRGPIPSLIVHRSGLRFALPVHDVVGLRRLRLRAPMPLAPAWHQGTAIADGCLLVGIDPVPDGNPSLTPWLFPRRTGPSRSEERIGEAGEERSVVVLNARDGVAPALLVDRIEGLLPVILDVLPATTPPGACIPMLPANVRTQAVWMSEPDAWYSLLWRAGPPAVPRPQETSQARGSDSQRRTIPTGASGRMARIPEQAPHLRPTTSKTSP